MPSKKRLRRVCAIAVLSLSAAALAACTSSNSTVRSAVAKKRSSEYFSEAEYGVKASPRVTNQRSRLKRGGGREQIGRPYQIRGKWYYPKEDRKYAKVGAASWYGDAFHGRLTANGEIYDMTHLTAAHPTMPLPSYARVTNMKNGASVIVRVNDRGPYSNGRIIDMSRRAAEMLDYVHSGTAKVKVEYVGRAPIDGQDDAYLMASYRPGNVAPDPSDGLPTGVMVAMNGATPEAGAQTSPFPGTLTDAPAQPVLTAAMEDFDSGAPANIDVMLPDMGPILTYRPDGAEIAVASLSLSYASVSGEESSVFSLLKDSRRGDWKSGLSRSEPMSYVMVGAFGDEAEARRLSEVLSQFGAAKITSSIDGNGEQWFSLDLYPKTEESIDAALQAAWSHGAEDAMTVRN